MVHKVSVVVTVLNEALTITQLLDALINQSVMPDEVVIVDGGSCDETVALVAQFQTQKLPFSLLCLTKVGNRSLGRNHGITKARNKLIAITDAGCVPHLDWLEHLVLAYKETQAPVIAGYYDAKPKTAFETAEVPYVLVMPDKVDPSTFLPATRSMLIEKAAWLTVRGFNEQLSDNEDYDLALRFKAAQLRIVFAPDAKVRWLPRKNLKQFFVMIYRFARGDVQAGIVRPKVLAIFMRYLGGLVLALMGYWLLLLLGLIAYKLWAIAKNYRYARQAWYWLPVLQFTSDLAVMAGSTSGYFKRLK